MASQAVEQKEAANQDTGSSSNGASEAAKGAKVSRKRTKTGCLTCRKRRIKCGEERPTCNNCIKSKRQCEGYNQRVVFKDGMHGLYPPRAMGSSQPSQRFVQPYANLQPAPAGPSRQIAPAPTGTYCIDDQIAPLDQTLHSHIREHYADRAQNPQNYEHRAIGVTVPLNSLPSPRSQDGEYQEYPQKYQESLPSPRYGERYSPDGYQQTPSSATSTTFSIPPPRSSSISEHAPPSLFGPAPQTYVQQPQQQAAHNHYNQPPSSSQSVYSPSTVSTSSTTSPPNNCPLNVPLDPKYAMVSGAPGEHQQSPRDYNDIFNQRSDLPESSEIQIKTEYSDQTPFPFCMDEFGIMPPEPEIDYDQESEDELDEEDEDDDGEYRNGTQEDGMIMMETIDSNGCPLGTRQQISSILEPFSRNLDEQSRISFQSYLPEASMLATYNPTLSSNPLMDPTTAKIFCHFVYVLGPRMHGPQQVWSYTVPLLSLSHPPLLHAILALSSLHISKLTHGTTDPALNHYQFALRRLGKAIASDKYRGHVATLAATLMLAYYETMAAEHDKWSSHIHGAKQLLAEIDFDRVTRRVEMIDEEDSSCMQAAEAAYCGQKGPSKLAMRKMKRKAVSDEADQNLKSYFMGGRGTRPQKPKKAAGGERAFSRKEMDHLRLQADMIWWYSKMDCYQSLLSGCPLVLDFSHWGQCPPRARVGTLGTTYGSSDHYFLLLARLCDFQVRDLKRKQAVYRENGFQWVPPPEMGGPPRGYRGPPPAHGGPQPEYRGPQPNSLYGPPPGHNPMEDMPFDMMPTPPGQPQYPAEFEAALPPNERILHHNIPEPLPESTDFDDTYAEAEAEWHEIAKAFQVLQDNLGPEYQPLGIDYTMQGSSTPFGPAIYYRTYSIATLQMLYNMAMLVLHRCHPSMPHIALMATGVQARRTHQYAVDIVRIVAALVPTDSTTQINPALGASLIESTMPMFFAAVQFETQDQRDWVVKKLREISRLTGWSTAARIMLGCQRAWEKAAEMGLGPEYVHPPIEDEADMVEEHQAYYLAMQNGAGKLGEEGGRFLWQMAGRKTVDAAGVLGDRDEVTMRMRV